MGCSGGPASLSGLRACFSRHWRQAAALQTQNRRHTTRQLLLALRLLRELQLRTVPALWKALHGVLLLPGLRGKGGQGDEEDEQDGEEDEDGDEVCSARTHTAQAPLLSASVLFR